jgi:uroporphyrinogen-III synthase
VSKKVILLTNAVFDSIKPNLDFKKQKFKDKYPNDVLEFYHWPALFLEPIISPDYIYDFLELDLNLDLKQDKPKSHILIWTSPTSIDLFMHLLEKLDNTKSSKILSWINSQKKYAMGKISAQRLKHYGVDTNFIDQDKKEANSAKLLKLINSDYKDAKSPIILFRGEQSRFDFKAEAQKLSFECNELIFYTQKENKNNLPKQWVSALESFDKDKDQNKNQNNDIEFIVDLTSTNGVKSFQDSIKFSGLSEKMKSITDSSICEHESFRGSIFLKE